MSYPLQRVSGLTLNPILNSQICPGILSLLDAYDCLNWRLHVPAVCVELESEA